MRICPASLRGKTVKDQDCVQFLQWSLPKLKMHWKGFRKVRGQICKRIERRMRELGMLDVFSYRTYLEENPAEWSLLGSLYAVTISRFYRDQAVFQFLEREVIPKLAAAAAAEGSKELAFWSIGCASGEEPYTLALLWDLSVGHCFPEVKTRIIATEINRKMIERARSGCYPYSSVRGLPDEWLAKAYIRRGDEYCIRREELEKVMFLEQDVRMSTAEGMYHLILCRNIVFTYFEDGLQREIVERIRSRLFPGGALVIGVHESLPSGAEGFAPWSGKLGVYLSIPRDKNAGDNGENGKHNTAAAETEMEQRHKALKYKPDSE